VSISTPGSYTVSYLSSSNLCATTSTANISITADEDGGFIYAAAEYCKSGSNPTPTITGTSGGTFSSGSGLVINSSTGTIDLGASTTGIYTVSYLTSSNQCAVTGTFSVTITADEVANISFGASNYCQSDSDPTPSITGVTGGIFSSTSGLNINTSTGEVDVSVSTPGSYTVSYLSSSNLCATTSTANISITADEDGSFTYAAAEYCKSGSNPTPTITGTSGGTFSSTSGLVFVSSSTGEINLASSTAGTYTVSYLTSSNQCAVTGTFSVTITADEVASISFGASNYCQSDSDPTPSITGVTGGTFSSTSGLNINSSTGEVDVSASTPGSYTVSYLSSSNLCATTSTANISITADEDGGFTYAAAEYCKSGSNPTPTITGTSGGTFSSTSGLVFVSSSTGEINLASSTAGTYTVSYLTSSNQCAVTGTFSVTITADEVASISFGASNYCQSDSDPTPSITGVTGGTFSSTSGLNINSSTGEVDVSASTPGSYTVSYLSSSNLCATTSTANISITADEDGGFTYAAAEYCKSGSNPTPTITGTSGGTFSSTSGLVFVSFSTGEINLASSTAGTYTVSYLTSSNQCAVTGTYSITVLPTESAAFSYGSAIYCETDSDPTPTVTGTSGGTFSATPSGLSLNASTGAIDLDASTLGSYTVQYVSSTSICAVTGTFNVTLTATNTVSVNGAYDISTATYVQNFSVLSQEGNPTGIVFNNDGTKMYILGDTGNDVNEYNLSTAFDVSTASYVQAFAVGSQETNPQGITFNNDGTKMYISGYNGDDVNEYSLSTAFDVSTASYVQRFVVSSQESVPRDITFNNDGTKMYVIGSSGDDVNEYSLSTAYDVSTASYVQNFSVAAQETSPQGIIFNNDGTKMFVTGVIGDDVNEYNLSTAFDISTASYVQNFSVAAQELTPQGITFNNDGSKMFVVGSSGYDVNEYSLDNPADQTVCVNEAITNITFNTTGATGIGSATNLPTGVTAAWSSNVLTISGTPSVAGTYAYSVPLTGGCGSVAATGTITVLPTESAAFAYASATYCETDSDPTPTVTGTSGGTFSATPSGLSINASSGAIDLDASTLGSYTVQYVTSSSICADSTTFIVTLTATNKVSVNGAYDISTATYVQNFSVIAQDHNPYGIVFNNDGTKMYILGDSGNDVNEYNLSTAFDVSTASYVQRFSVASQEINPQGITFNNDGTKMYITGYNGDDVNEYSLSTAFDVSTAAYTQRFSVASQEAIPRDITFNNDGTKMYVIGSSGDDVNEYSLSTAYDVSTASYTQRFLVNSQETNPHGITFNYDGTMMFVVGSIGDDVNEYSLSTAYDVSTASYVQNFSVATQEAHPTGIIFNNDGTKMFVVGISGDNVYEYSLENLAVQTVCVNDAITNITFNTTGATGIGTATNLPTGVTAAWSSNVLTISGTPSVAGTYAYSVPLTGGCGSVAATGTITVLPTESAAFTYASATYCETDSDPTPTVTGTSGGTFSATPSGLSINATTGAIDLSTSSIGTYAVKYVSSSSVCADSTTFNVTLTATNTLSVNGAYDISTATYIKDFSVSSQESSPSGIVFNNDGTKMYVIGGSGDDVNEYNLSTAFDVSTATYVQRFSVYAQETYPTGVAFNNDGTKMFVVGDYGNDINEYSLSNAFDVSTAVYTQVFSVNSQEIYPTGMTFNNDGTKMYVIGYSGDDVNEYTLTTGFDVSTASYVQNFSVATQEANPSGITFNNDGTKMYVIGYGGDNVNEYSLSTAFDVSTASYVQNFSVNSQETAPRGLTFNNDGTKLFVVGSVVDKVFEYSLNNPAVQTVCVNDAITNITFNTTGATGIGTPTNLPTGVTAAWSSNVLTISGTTSVAGTYAYSVPLTGGCGSVAATGTITVLPMESAAFTYASAEYCLSGSNPTPTVTGTSGGTFSSTTGLNINASTGEIDLAASTAGTYTVSYLTSSNPCASTGTFDVTITDDEDGTFTYASAEYCKSGTNPTPTVTGTSGGTFSSTTGLSINASTGEIDLTASTAGTYTVSYLTSSNTCAVTGTFDVTITEDEDGTFTYASAGYCVSGIDPTPNITGTTGGTFSSTTGLSINASTGEIDLSASTAGTYTVSYLTSSNTCAVTGTFDVTITDDEDGTFTYASTEYCKSGTNPTPNITGTTGGTFSSTTGLSINASTGEIDLTASTAGTYTVSYLTSSNTCAVTGTFDVTITEDEDGTFTYASAGYCVSGIDPTPNITGTTGGTFSSTTGLSINASTGEIDLSASTAGTYTVSYLTSSNTCAVTGTFDVTITDDEDGTFTYAATEYCKSGTNPTPTVTGTSGGTFSSTTGLSINASTGEIDLTASTAGTYTVSYLTSSNTCAVTGTFDVTITDDEDGTFTYASAGYCVSGIDPTPNITGLTGGTFSSTTGLSINASTGEIDLAASTAGTYTVSYLTSSNTCAVTGTFDVTITDDEDGTFTYAATEYCQSGIDPTPNITGTTGGTFSSTTGLSINASTGEIDLTASTAGTYTVSYLTSSNTCAVTGTFDVTITEDEDGTFTYASAGYCVSGIDPTPNITGTTGGTFSSTTGLSINASTGEIDLSASTAGTYTVSYLTSSNTCAVTGTFDVTITDDEDGTFTYAATEYCKSGTNPTPNCNRNKWWNV
jgi:hypothetical protein